MTNPLGPGAFPLRRTFGILTASLLSFCVNAATLTRDNGAAVGDNQNSHTVGATDPVLLQDVQLIQKLQRFDRQRRCALCEVLLEKFTGDKKPRP